MHSQMLVTVLRADGSTHIPEHHYKDVPVDYRETLERQHRDWNLTTSGGAVEFDYFPPGMAPAGREGMRFRARFVPTGSPVVDSYPLGWREGLPTWGGMTLGR